MAFWNLKYPYVNDEILNLDWVLSEMKKLTALMAELEEKVAAIDITKEEVVSLVNTALETAKAYTDEAINSNFYGVIKPYVDEVVESASRIMKAYVDSQDEDFYRSASSRMDHLYEDAINYIDSKVLNVLLMNNPITGEEQPIPDVINDIVNTFHKSNALTAGQYDGYELTAQGYDGQLITAFSYDFDGVNAVNPNP